MPGEDAAVLDRLWETIESRRDADPEVSHSARLMSRGTAKVAQKFGEEAVECVIEAVRGDKPAGSHRRKRRRALSSCSCSGWMPVCGPEDVWAELDPARGRQRHCRKGCAAARAPNGPGGQDQENSVTLIRQGLPAAEAQ